MSKIKADSLSYEFLTHPDIAIVVDQWFGGRIMNHEFLSKLILIRDQVEMGGKDPHNPYMSRLDEV